MHLSDISIVQFWVVRNAGLSCSNPASVAARRQAVIGAGGLGGCESVPRLGSEKGFLGVADEQIPAYSIHLPGAGSLVPLHDP